MLCVPGLGLDGDAWQPTLRALAVGRSGSEIAELPGYGARPAREDDLRPAVLGARVVTEWLGRRDGPVVLLGHSASCQVVAHAAALAPGRVAALVLVGPTTDPRAASWPRLASRWLRTAVRERPGQVPLLVRTYAKVGLWWMLRAMRAARRDDVREPLRQLRCPVLVVRGRHDRICPAEWGRELVATAPAGSRLVTLAAGGHMVPITHGRLVAAAVDAFVG